MPILMQTSEWVWQAAILVVLLVSLINYLRGWQRLRRVMPGLATGSRLLLFCLFTLCLIAALVWPLPGLSDYFLSARMLQKVALVFLGSPFYWLACGFHVILWGFPSPMRRWISRYLIRPSALTPAIRLVTAPLTVWFVFLASFLAWHDTTAADWLLSNAITRSLAPLWLMVAARFFWWQIVATGPRRFTTQSPATRLACLVSVEIPNIAAGMYIAFHEMPLYTHYQRMREQFPTYYLNAISTSTDQSVSGAMNWVFGSIVYFSSIILVVNALWQRVSDSDQPRPPVNWDADEKFIMPGLEQRVTENQHKKVSG